MSIDSLKVCSYPTHPMELKNDISTQIQVFRSNAKSIVKVEEDAR